MYINTYKCLLMQELYHVIMNLVLESTLMHSQAEKLLGRPTLRTQNFEAGKDKYANVIY